MERNKMKVFIATDYRCVYNNGVLYLAQRAYNVLKRYADAFGNIVLCARTESSAEITDDDVKADFISEFIPLNNLSEIMIGRNDKFIVDAIKKCDLIILRLPSFLAIRAGVIAAKQRKPYIAELMGDAWDGLWNHGISGKIIAPYAFMKTKSIAKKANYAIYVTSEFLQKRYPCPNQSLSASNVVIKDVDDAVLTKRIKKLENTNSASVKLMTTAAVNVRFKGQRYVIEAIPKLNKQGIRVEYILVGGGDQTFLRKLADKYKVSNQVKFLGRQPINKVFELLDESDIYIQPSLQEGLPRAVIEAMSRGCTAIGTRTAGIPELIDPRFVVRRKNVNDIVEKIKWFCNSSIEEKKSNAIRNFNESKQYLSEVLDNRRNKYFEKIREEI